ncbi:MAG: ATP-NAD kinase family protein [Candidatus Thermoplasmatota archaeon]|nr:ATP-NAD kinase family protein [Candidatus Thermoplasmatota archaeon]
MKVGMFINPVAGCGILLGLKGSDRLTYSMCPHPVSLELAVSFLKELKDSEIEFIIPSGVMGERAFKEAGMTNYSVIYTTGENTDSSDTLAFLKALKQKDPDMLVFFGGDGTARDVVDAAPSFPVLGVPAGSKMYSSVFAISVKAAVEVLRDFKAGRITEISEAQVIDLNEDAYSSGRLETRMYGELFVPRSSRIVTESKAEYTDDYVEEAAEYIAEHMEKDTDYLIGPGTTCKRILAFLGLQGSLLGFDLVRNGKVLDMDMTEDRIYNTVNDATKIIISPIGGQGFLLGRGNRQLSSRALRKINLSNIIIIASAEKLASVTRLYVDTGPEKLSFPEYVKVIYGYGKFKMMRVEYYA